MMARIIIGMFLRTGADVIYVEPEFGPAPYMTHLPYTDMPVADLWAINSWIHQRIRVRNASLPIEG